MIIDLCLITSDNNETYCTLYPIVKKVWEEKFKIKVLYILVAEEIPITLRKYKEIILFKPIVGLHTAYIAQTIRLLYPCLYPEKNIIISDMDILPISKDYFINSVIDIPDDKFICYRDAYLNQNMIGMCYNLARGSTWKQFFNVETIDDINNKLIEWYNKNYNGKKNCPGWYSDQEILYKYVYGKNNVIIFKDKDMKFNRLDKREKEYVLKLEQSMIDNIKNEVYTDFHIIRPYTRKNIKRTVDFLVKNIINI